jgi:hypothetical protein
MTRIETNLQSKVMLAAVKRHGIASYFFTSPERSPAFSDSPETK